MLQPQETGWLYWKAKKGFILCHLNKDKGLCEIKNVNMIFKKGYSQIIKLFKKLLKNILL
jgi:hypothetical protein